MQVTPEIEEKIQGWIDKENLAIIIINYYLSQFFLVSFLSYF